MKRGEWADFASSVLSIEPAIVRTLVRRARLAKIVHPGPHGKNAKSFTDEEVLRLIEALAVSLATGSSSKLEGCKVDWHTGNLTVTLNSVVVRTVFIPKDTVNMLLARPN